MYTRKSTPEETAAMKKWYEEELRKLPPGYQATEEELRGGLFGALERRRQADPIVDAEWTRKRERFLEAQRLRNAAEAGCEVPQDPGVQSSQDMGQLQFTFGG
jgi:hypothetical protein